MDLGLWNSGPRLTNFNSRYIRALNITKLKGCNARGSVSFLIYMFYPNLKAAEIQNVGF